MDLTVVVPYYNPGPRFRPTIDGLVTSLSKAGLTFEVIAVSDGSTDGSEATLDGCDPALVRRITYAANQGKGEALRTGLAQGQGDLLAFIDADGDLPPEQMAGAVQLAQTEQLDILVGSKNHPDSTIASSLLRRVFSRLWQGFVVLLFHLKVADTQTGLKVMRRAVVEQCLPLTHQKGFAFDLELLVVARQLGFTKVAEFPVQLVERTGSTVKIKTALRMLWDAGAIFRRCYLQRSYDQ